MSFLNWSRLASMVGDLHDDKEMLPVIVEFRNGERFLTRSWSERDYEVVLLLDTKAPNVNERLSETDTSVGGRLDADCAAVSGTVGSAVEPLLHGDAAGPTWGAKIKSTPSGELSVGTIRAAIFDVIDHGQQIGGVVIRWAFNRFDESDRETERRGLFVDAVIARIEQLQRQK